jgi:hypothetical protein
MPDVVDQPEFDYTIGQQPKGPAPLALRWCTTGQGNPVSFHLTGDFLGCPWWQRLLVECRRQARGHKATADIPDRIAMAAQGLGNGLVLPRGRLGTIQEQQNPGSGVRPGPSAARADQSVECGTLVVCQGN